MNEPEFPNCPRCGKPMEFSGFDGESLNFPRQCYCETCKIAMVGKTDRSAWETLIYFEPKKDQ